MKRYLVFGWDVDEAPGGGWEDFMGDVDDIESARELVNGAEEHFSAEEVETQIIDGLTGTKVEST